MNKQIKISIAVGGVLILGLLTVCHFTGTKNRNQQQRSEVVQLTTGRISNAVSTSGEVQPQNRLEVNAPISGRIDQILVREGDVVARGQILAYMSSTDRATLMDAAQNEGTESRQYWESVYKNTAIVAPLAGTVIVRSLEPGQTVAQNAVILVLSDHLIVQAKVDETDIGKVKVGQKAVITLDSYPQHPAPARVEHIAYESTVVNNVTTYQVDVLPLKVPDFFRSGMSATVDIITSERIDVQVLPVDAVRQETETPYVVVERDKGRLENLPVKLGLADDKHVEILSGLQPGDRVVIAQPDYSALQVKTKTNPFMPPRPGRGKSSQGGKKQ